MLTHVCQMDEHAYVHTCTHARMHACTHARMHACQENRIDEHANMVFLLQMHKQLHHQLNIIA